MSDATQPGASSETAGADFAAQVAQAAGLDGETSAIEREEEPRSEDGQAEPETVEATSGEAEQQVAADVDPEVTVKVNGEERKVKQSELVAHFQKGDASARRFEEAAAIRKEVEARGQAIKAKEAQLQQAIEHWQRMATQAMDEPDWDHLSVNDPTEYIRQQRVFEKRQQQIAQAQAAQAYLKSQAESEQAEHAKAIHESESQALAKALPVYADKEKGVEAKKALREFLAKSGFSDDEIGGFGDHRAVVLSHKALMYDRMIADQAKARAETQAKLSKLPPVRAEAPGGGEKTQSADRAAAMKRLSRSGDIKDAVGLLSELI